MIRKQYVGESKEDFDTTAVLSAFDAAQPGSAIADAGLSPPPIRVSKGWSTT